MNKLRIMLAGILCSTTLHVSAASALKAQHFAPDTTWEQGFTNDKSALPLVLKVIGSAKKQILVAAYSFTNREIAQALVEARNNGIEVMVVADANENSHYTSLGILTSNNIPVRVNNNFAIMHSSYIVVDNKTIQTGSLPYTKSVKTSNSDNVLVLWNARTNAESYITNWNVLWNGGSKYALPANTLGSNWSLNRNDKD